MDPFQTCDLLLSLVKNSNLNFSLSESPFSVSLSIKKSFIRKANGILRASNICEFSSQGLKEENKILKDKNIGLQAVIEQTDALENTVHELSSKLQKANEFAETTSKSNNNMLEKFKRNTKQLDEKTEEIKLLKGVIAKHTEEVAKYKSEIKETTKLIKSNQKETHNLEKKVENQQNTIKNLKDANNKIKNENKKLENAKKHSEKKAEGLEKNLAAIKSANTKDSESKINTSTAAIQVEIPCNKCIETSSSEGKIKNHVGREHVDQDNNNNIKCIQGLKMFSTNKELEAHVNDHQIPSASTDFSCTFCEQTFLNFAKLIVHIKGAHQINLRNSRLAATDQCTVALDCNSDQDHAKHAEDHTGVTLAQAKEILEKVLKKQLEDFRKHLIE